jgi:outer membrane lipoprotein-sorting protein
MAVSYFRVLLLGTLVASALAEQSANEYLQLTAQTYKQLRSFQVEAEVRRTRENEGAEVIALITVYSVPPYKARIETKDVNRSLQSLLVSDGKTVTEYRPSTKEYTVFPVNTLALSFTPERGAGWGEMLYDTIAERVHKVSIRGRQVLEVGSDRTECVVVDVDYGLPTVRYTFWLARKSGLVLRRVATSHASGKTESTVSTVRALTMNESIPDSVFEFSSAGALAMRVSQQKLLLWVDRTLYPEDPGFFKK